MSVFNYPYKCGYPHWYTSKDIHARICKRQLISVKHKYPWLAIHVLWISVYNYPFLYGYAFGYPWISMNIHAWTCHGFSIQGWQVSSPKISDLSDILARQKWQIFLLWPKTCRALLTCPKLPFYKRFKPIHWPDVHFHSRLQRSGKCEHSYIGETSTHVESTWECILNAPDGWIDTSKKN